MIDWAFAIALLLNLTGSFSFAASFAGVSIATASLALLVVQCMYLVWRWPLTVRLLRRRAILLWLGLLLAWPLLSLMWAPEQSARLAGLQVYYVSLLLGAAVFVRARGWRPLAQVAGWAILVSIVGLWLSWWRPELFALVRELADTPPDYFGRPFGFFLQPNDAAMSITALFMLRFVGLKPDRHLPAIAAVLALLTLVVWTGSRSMFVSAIAVGLTFLAHRTTYFRVGGYRLSPAVRGIVGAMVLVAVSWGVGFGLTAGGDMVRDTPVGAMVERIRSLDQVNQSFFEQDGSAVERLLAMSQYLDLVSRRPFTGYGLGAADTFRATGELPDVSHNLFLELAFHYGIPYVVGLLALTWRLWRHRARPEIEASLGSNLVNQFVVAFVLSGCFSSMVLASRVLMVVLGALLGAYAASAREITVVRREVREPARSHGSEVVACA